MSVKIVRQPPTEPMPDAVRVVNDLTLEVAVYERRARACTWTTAGGDGFETACGRTSPFKTGRYCPFCGGVVEEMWESDSLTVTGK